MWTCQTSHAKPVEPGFDERDMVASHFDLVRVGVRVRVRVRS